LVADTDCEISNAQRTQFNNILLNLTSGEITQSQKTHAPWGLPTGGESENTLLVNGEYAIKYSPQLFIPRWASYELTADDIVARTRKNCFRPDPRLAGEDSAVLDDYVEPVFDRGHLVPRADMNRTKAAMINTFVLSNMMPQHDNFNQGVWETLESYVRLWAVVNGNIYVLSGPVFDKDNNQQPDSLSSVDRVEPTDRLGLPTHFYKIVVHEQDNGFVASLAILLPHTDNEMPKSSSFDEKTEWLADHITSIDAIEKVTGYDFFPAMDDTKEAAMESSVEDGLWETE